MRRWIANGKKKKYPTLKDVGHEDKKRPPLNRTCISQRREPVINVLALVTTTKEMLLPTGIHEKREKRKPSLVLP